jgi:hypothetical protein
MPKQMLKMTSKKKNKLHKPKIALITLTSLAGLSHVIGLTVILLKKPKFLRSFRILTTMKSRKSLSI